MDHLRRQSRAELSGQGRLARARRAVDDDQPAPCPQGRPDPPDVPDRGALRRRARGTRGPREPPG
ncbi:hypothetical protein NKG05_30310 [Oerskovia sp. M15]